MLDQKYFKGILLFKPILYGALSYCPLAKESYDIF